jgi:hypothetical protein
MEKEKQVQTNKVAKTTTTTTATASAIEQYGEYIVLPTLYITREPYVSKNQNRQLWSYNVEVQFYGQTKKVGLQTPDSDEFGNFHKDKRDKYGYQVLDAMFEVLGSVPLAIKLNKTANDVLRSVEYFAVGFELVGDQKILVDHIQLVTQKTSSESLLRSAINRLSLANGWGLPTL